MNTVSFPGLGFEVTVNKVAFSIGSFHVRWYGVIIAVAFVTAMIYCFRRIPKFGLNADRVIDVIMAGIVGGVVGARLYYVAFAWEEFSSDPIRIIMTWQGGMAIYGGLIGALLTGVIMARIRGVKILPMLDLASSGFLIGQSIGRWGNFVNQEAFGTNTTLPWGMTSESVRSYLAMNQLTLYDQGIQVTPDVPVHPCFLYESIWCLLGFLLLHYLTSKRKFDGELFFVYIGWYGLGRAFIEGLRTDSLMMGTLRVSQLVAILCVIASICLIVALRQKKQRSGDPAYMRLYVETEEAQAVMDGSYYERQKEEKRARKNMLPNVPGQPEAAPGETPIESAADASEGGTAEEPVLEKPPEPDASEEEAGEEDVSEDYQAPEDDPKQMD